MKRRTCLTVCGGFSLSRNLLIFEFIGDIPPLVMVLPKNSMDGLPNSHFVGVNFSPLDLIQSNKDLKLLVISSTVKPRRPISERRLSWAEVPAISAKARACSNTSGYFSTILGLPEPDFLGSMIISPSVTSTPSILVLYLPKPFD